MTIGRMLKHAQSIQKLEIKGRSDATFARWSADLLALTYVFPSLGPPLAFAASHRSAESDTEGITGSVPDQHLMLLIAHTTTSLARTTTQRLQAQHALEGTPASGAPCYAKLSALSTPSTSGDVVATIRSLTFSLRLPATGDLRFPIDKWREQLAVLSTVHGFNMPTAIVNVTLLCALPEAYRGVESRFFALPHADGVSTDEIVQAVQSLYAGVLQHANTPLHHANAAGPLQRTHNVRFAERNHSTGTVQTRPRSQPPGGHGRPQRRPQPGATPSTPHTPARAHASRLSQRARQHADARLALRGGGRGGARMQNHGLAVGVALAPTTAALQRAFATAHPLA